MKREADSSKRESIGLSFCLREEIDLRFEGEEGNRLQIPRRQTKRLFEGPI